MARNLFAEDVAVSDAPKGRNLFANSGEPSQPGAPQVEPMSISEAMASNPNIEKLQGLIAQHSNSPDKSTVRVLNESLQKEIAKTMQLAQLRSENPALAETIEGMPQWERSAVNFGRGMTDIGRGLGLVGEEVTPALDALQSQTSGGEGARMLGQMAPFAPLGVGASAIRGAIPSAMAYSGLGATEGYTSQTGMGEDPTLATAIGAAAPVLAVGAPKLASWAKGLIDKRIASKDEVKQILEAAKPSEIVDQVDELIKTQSPDAAENVRRLVLDSSVSESAHPTVKKIAAVVEGGGNADDIAKVIDEQKLKATEGAAAKFALENGKVTSNPNAKEIIRLGMPDNDAQMITSTARNNRDAFNKMLTYAESGVKSSAAKNRFHPQSVVGDSLKDRLKEVTRINREAGTEINKAASNLKGERVVLNDAFNSFTGRLDDLGVKYDGGKLNFEKSDLVDLPELQAPIERVIKRLDPSRNPNVTAYDAHVLKRWFDKNINYDKSVKGAMDADVERAIKGFRADINKAIGDISPEYRAANKKYAESIDAIDQIKSVAGKRRDLSGDSADETLGMLAKRVTSNAMSRGAVSDSIKALEDIAAKYGKPFKVSVVNQVQFVTAMEKNLRAFSDTSLMGQVTTANKVAGAATGTRGMLDVADDAFKYVKGKIKPKDEQAYIKALRKLINESE